MPPISAGNQDRQRQHNVLKFSSKLIFGSISHHFSAHRKRHEKNVRKKYADGSNAAKSPEVNRCCTPSVDFFSESAGIVARKACRKNLPVHKNHENFLQLNVGELFSKARQTSREKRADKKEPRGRCLGQ